MLFALSSRDKTNRSTDTSILCCYNKTINAKKLDIKNNLFLRSVFMCVGVVVVVFSFHSGVGFSDGTMLPHLISFLLFLTRLAKQNKQTEEDCSFHTINGSVCLVQ